MEKITSLSPYKLLEVLTDQLQEPMDWELDEILLNEFQKKLDKSKKIISKALEIAKFEYYKSCGINQFFSKNYEIKEIENKLTLHDLSDHLSKLYIRLFYGGSKSFSQLSLLKIKHLGRRILRMTGKIEKDDLLYCEQLLIYKSLAKSAIISVKTSSSMLIQPTQQKEFAKDKLDKLVELDFRLRELTMEFSKRVKESVHLSSLKISQHL